MSKPRKFRHTTMAGNVTEVTWTPEGLEIEINGQRKGWTQDEEGLLEYGGPLLDPVKLRELREAAGKGG